MKRLFSEKKNSGFTLLELMVALCIIGILTGISIPLATAYKLKADYANLELTLRYLMDGEETYFIENGSFYPENYGIVTIDRGEQRALPELKYTFPEGHKHRYRILGFNRNLLGYQYNILYIYVYADFDLDGNGRDDLYIAQTYLTNNKPREINGLVYYRSIQQLW